MAVVLDTGAVSRGSGNQGSNRERDIRKAFTQRNLLTQGDRFEAVVLLPEKLFYKTTAPGMDTAGMEAMGRHGRTRPDAAGHRAGSGRE
jgi:type I restriction enzyme M protein